MILENKLDITNSAELAREEERLTKLRAKELFESGQLFEIEVGTFAGLSKIHEQLFSDIYDFAGKIRDVNIAKDNFQFAPRIFLEQSLTYIDKLSHSTFDEIIDKYADMNIAHPFREGNGRAMRIWLDNMLRDKLGKVVDWNSIDKDEYFNAMVRSHVATGELKYLLQNALTDDLGQATFFKGVDVSYHYEGYSLYKTEEVGGNIRSVIRVYAITHEEFGQALDFLEQKKFPRTLASVISKREPICQRELKTMEFSLDREVRERGIQSRGANGTCNFLPSIKTKITEFELPEVLKKHIDEEKPIFYTKWY